MCLGTALVAVTALLSCTQALSTRASSTLYSNTSQTSPSSSFSYSAPSVCCFIVQQTATENYWPISSYITYVAEVNLTSVTLSVTPFRNGTITNAITNIYTINATSSYAVDGAVNPISFYDDPVPQLIIQEATELPPNVTAVVTGGTTIQSPAAFFVYSTIQIITAAPVTNADGFVQCGTRSSWDGLGLNPEIQPTWPNINSNVEAFFGGYGIAGDNQEPTGTMTTTATTALSGSLVTTAVTQAMNATYYTNSGGSTISPHPVGTGVAAEIILTTPFVFMPQQGQNGATEATSCYESDETELYGYVPQTLVDMLGSDRHYVSQYPDLASCLPGGPSMIRRTECYDSPLFSFGPGPTYNSPVGGDISRTTVVTVTPSPEPPVSIISAAPQSDINPPKSTQTDAAPLNGDPSGGTDGQGAGDEGSNISSAGFNSAAQDEPTRTLPPGPSGPADFQTPTVQPISPQTTALPVGAIINSIIGGGGQGGNQDPGALITTIISGTPVFVIPSPTTVPAAGLPAGIGSTTIINGTPFVVIQPTTIPIPAGQLFSTTIINGTPFLVIPGPTSIPLAGAPSGLTGSTTTINGTPFLIIPGPTSVPALPGEITVIDGSTFDIFTGPTTVPVHSELSLVGVTTVISGTTMVVLPGATTVPVVKPSPSYVQVSGARRRRASLVGFGFELVRGFVGRFR